MRIAAEKLDALLSRHAIIEAELSAGPDAATFVALSREFAELSPVVTAIKDYRSALSELADLETLLNDPATDPEMASLAMEEKPLLAQKVEDMGQAIRLSLLPKDAADDKNAILEIRAGTGGDEAALFAGDLFRMYQRFSALQGWQVELMSASEGTAGGYKEIIAEIRAMASSPA